MIDTSFPKIESFLRIKDKACRIAINDNLLNNRGSKSAEFLAKYCDLLLKKGKNLEPNELEEKLTQLVIIQSFIFTKLF
jgi:hypothetical protein